MIKLDESNAKLDESKIELQKSNAKLEKSNSKADLLLKKNDILIKQNNVILEENRNVHKKLMLACNDRVKHTGVDADKNLLIVIKNNEQGYYEYTTLRVSVMSKSGRIKSHKNTHIKAKVVATIEAVPNAIILWKNIVRQLTEGEDAIISGRSANHFDINEEFTEEEMIEAFKRVSDMKFDIIEEDD